MLVAREAGGDGAARRREDGQSLMRSRALWAVLAAVLCALVAHLTRIEHELEITYDGEAVVVSVPGQQARLEVGNLGLSRVSFVGHRSMMSETVLCRLAVAEPDGSEQEWFDGWTALLLTRPWAGTCLRSPAPEFQPSFGDWTMDVMHGEPVPIPGGFVLPPRFTLRARVVGRGNAVLRLEGDATIAVWIRDGFIDNDLGILKEHGPSVGDARPEPIAVNVRNLLGQVAEVGLVAALLVLGVSVARRDAPGSAPAALHDSRFWAVVAILAVVHGLGCIVFARGILGGVPHIPDSAYYLRQARAIALAGSTTLVQPFSQDLEASIAPPFSQRGDGTLRLGHYERGWALLLAPLARIGAPYLLNGLLSAGVLALIALLGRRLLGDIAALGGAALWAVSPLSIIMAGDLMNHTATAFFLLSAAALAISARRPIWFVLAGVLFGWALWLRLLTSLVLAVPLGVMAWSARRGRGRVVLQVACFALGVAVMGAVMLADNASTTGDPLAFPRQVYHGLDLGPHRLPEGLKWADSTLASLPPILFGLPWPHLIPALALAALLLSPGRTSLALATAVPALFAAYACSNAVGLHGYGPRFYFEAVPLLFLLVAEGARLIVSRLPARARPLVVAAAATAFAWNVGALVTVLPRYEDYNVLRNEPARQAAALPRGSWLLVDEGSWELYEEFAAVFDPTFTELVVVRETAAATPERLRRERPGWRVFRMIDKAASIVPVRTEQPQPDTQGHELQ